MTTRRLATAFALAGALTVLGAGAAQADDMQILIALSGRLTSGIGDWTENGDTLTVCDQRSDGWGTRGYIYQPTPGDPFNGTVLIKVSDPEHDGDCVAVSKNLSETISIAIKVCNYQGAKIAACEYAVIPR